jgi:4-hydroxy-tetrahydrodipicolinate synthase
MARSMIPDGVWPTMITPFREDGTIDYTALERMVDWYVDRGVAGLFAVCQSSEMFHLSLRERLDLARACVRFAAGRVPVIASGHVADAAEDQLEEARVMAHGHRRARAAPPVRPRDEDDEVFEAVGRFLEAPRRHPTGFYDARTHKRLLAIAMGSASP